MSDSSSAVLDGLIWRIIGRIAQDADGPTTTVRAQGAALHVVLPGDWLRVSLKPVDPEEQIDEANLLKAAALRSLLASGARCIVASRDGYATLFLDAQLARVGGAGEEDRDAMDGFIVLSGINTLALAATWLDPTTIVETKCRVHLLSANWWEQEGQGVSSVINPLVASELPTALAETSSAELVEQPTAPEVVASPAEETSRRRVDLFLQLVAASTAATDDGDTLLAPAAPDPRASLIAKGRRVEALLNWDSEGSA